MVRLKIDVIFNIFSVCYTFQEKKAPRLLRENICYRVWQDILRLSAAAAARIEYYSHFFRLQLQTIQPSTLHFHFMHIVNNEKNLSLAKSIYTIHTQAIDMKTLFEK